jgi:hypothetical protein
LNKDWRRSHDSDRSNFVRRFGVLTPHSWIVKTNEAFGTARVWKSCYGMVVGWFVTISTEWKFFKSFQNGNYWKGIFVSNGDSSEGE